MAQGKTTIQLDEGLAVEVLYYLNAGQRGNMYDIEDVPPHIERFKVLEVTEGTIDQLLHYTQTVGDAHDEIEQHLEQEFLH